MPAVQKHRSQQSSFLSSARFFRVAFETSLSLRQASGRKLPICSIHGEFRATIQLGQGAQSSEFELTFAEQDHRVSGGAHHRDNNMRADAAVSVLVIAILLMARAFGWLWMDPLAGLIGVIVIANLSFGLLRDTGGILLADTRRAHGSKRSCYNRERRRAVNGPPPLEVGAWPSRRDHFRGDRE